MVSRMKDLDISHHLPGIQISFLIANSVLLQYSKVNIYNVKS